MSVIKCENIAKRIKSYWVFENLSFELCSGEIILVVGDNGSGKSVLLLTLARVLKTNRGKIYYQNGRKTSISYSPYHLGLDEFLSVKANMNYFVKDKAAVQEQMDIWGLTEMRKKNVSQLSSGQRKRVSLARAMATDADVYLLDEPTTGLDKQYLSVLNDQIKTKKDQGKGIILATHQSDVFKEFEPKLIEMAVK